MRRIFITAVVFLAAELSVNGQSARVSGQVVDASQAVVKGSIVTIRNLETEGQFRTVSAEEGSFLLPPVPPGRYEITASAAGFAITRVTALTLEVGESKVIKLELKPESLSEVVTVSDTPPELTTDRPDRSVVIDRSFVESIPLNVRNPLQLINFSPAVTKGDDGLSGQNITSESRTNTWRINGAKGRPRIWQSTAPRIPPRTTIRPPEFRASKRCRSIACTPALMLPSSAAPAAVR